MIAARFSLRRIAVCAGVVLAAATVGWPAGAAVNDYPTSTRVDYVLGCMAANGQSYLVMEKCSCSIDVIAELFPYEHYEQVETILRMRERRGELGMLFRTMPGLEEQVQEFKQAQVEADLRCF